LASIREIPHNGLVKGGKRFATRRYGIGKSGFCPWGNCISIAVRIAAVKQ
jgi:hypothetical protein